MKRKAYIDCLDANSIQGAIDLIERLQAALDGAKLRAFVRELGALGCSRAQIRYAAAWYDGENDVKVDVSDVASDGAEAHVTITASGEAVLFIEFGTGVYYADNLNVRSSLLPGSEVVGRGEYGKKKGRRQTWVYIDTAGNKVFTHGNPSNACMYDARKEVESRMLATAKEVFRW